MITLENPEDLFVAVRRHRRTLGITLHDLIRSMRRTSTDPQRSTRSLSKQFSEWELGHKVPYLTSLPVYLRVHHLALGLISASELDTATAWCDGRDRGRDRCAMMDGHGGPHRTYAGNEF